MIGTAYSLDFSKCYYFESNSIHFEDYSKIVGMVNWIYVSNYDRIYLIEGGLGWLFENGYDEELYERINELLYKQQFEEMVNEY